MDEVSFILLLLLATIMALFIKFLYQLYKDRGQLSVMVSAVVQCSAVEERDKMSPRVTRFLTLRRTGNQGSLSCLNTSTTVLMTVR